MYVFHIGLHKTGTTTLQALMAANAKALAARGIVYPAIGAGSSQSALAFAIRDGRGTDAPAWMELRALEAEARDRTVLVSAEDFESVDPSIVRTGIEGDEAQIIVYIRDPMKWFVSVYSQQSKVGGSRISFDTYFEKRLGRRNDLADRILSWADVFGRDRVRVRSIEPECLVNGNLIDDFLSALGTTREDLVIPRNANETPDWRVVELLKVQHARHWTKDPGKHTRDYKLSQQIFKAGLAAGERLGWRERAEYLTREQRRQLAAHHRSDRERLLAAIPDSRISDIDFDLDRERPFLPAPEAVPEVDRQAFEEAFAEILAKQQAQGVPEPGRHLRQSLRNRAKRYYERLKKRLWPPEPEERKSERGRAET